MDGCFQADLLTVKKIKFSLILRKYLGTLAISLGCFPFDSESYTQSLTTLLSNITLFKKNATNIT